ncbi:MAG: DUF2232 domain-containing protein [Rhodospirillaceae bacterium]|nr:DUF2232 domain-containing protein [Rhodospirillaceae bacterium]
MNRSALLAVAAGVFGATLLVAALQGSLFGVAFGLLFSSLPLAMAVLGLGPAVLSVAVMGGAVTVTILMGSFGGALIYLLFDVLPVALLTRFANQEAEGSKPAGVALGFGACWLALAGCAVLGLVLVMMPAGPDGLEASLKAGMDKLLAEMIAAMAAAKGETEQMNQAAETLRASVSLLPGAAGWNWCLRAIASAALAQGLLVRLGYARWPSPSYRRMAVPGWFIAVFGASFAVAGLAGGDLGFVAKNVAMVMCLPLLLQGLTVVHCGIGRLGNASMLLAGFYVLALLTSALSFAVLVSLGLVDHFLKLRERMDARPQGGV